MPPAFVDRIRRLVDRAALPVTAPDWTAERWLELMRSDKKALAGRLRFVLPRRLGEVALFDDVAESDVLQVLQQVQL